MPRKKMDSQLSAIKSQHLGTVYRLIEQFDLISRIDLSKLSGFAPASITALTRELIQAKLVIERTAQTSVVRGRPAVGLCVSPFHWQLLCATLMENSFEILLCELNGTPLKSQKFALREQDFADLAPLLRAYLQQFLQLHEGAINHLLTFSIAVVGELDRDQQSLKKLGQRGLELNLVECFEGLVDVPILVTEYFQTWLLAESTVGSLMSSNNVLFLQLDDVINMSVLIRGEILQHEKQKRMNINKVVVPQLSPLQDFIGKDLPEIERYQLHNQVTHQAIYQLMDGAYPNNQLANDEAKIEYLCNLANQGDKPAIAILEQVAEAISYVLMNLVNIFSSEKIMISSSLLLAKDIFLNHLNKKLRENLLVDEHQVEIVTSQYAWNTPVIAAAAIKQGIYDGSLFPYLFDAFASQTEE